jgi:hypothetical protein
MALVNDTQINALANDYIENDIPYAMTAAAKAASKTQLAKYLKRMFGYIAGGGPGAYNSNKGWLEVKGVKAGLDAAPVGGRTIETYTSGFGSNHAPSTAADLAAPPYPVSGSVVDNKADVSTQNNDGTGLVS